MTSEEGYLLARSMSLHSCRWAIEALGFDLETIIENYKSWVVVLFYVVVSGWNEYKKDYEFGCFRSPKRGDKKYSQKILRRFNDLRKQLPKESFFSWGERDRNKIMSPCVFVTLTYEHDIAIEDSWKEVGKDFNRWITRLRKKYGKIDVVRVFEALESGYCHVHAVLYFRNMMWKGFRWDKWIDGKRQITYRVGKVEEFKKGWQGGFSDFLLMNTSHAGFYYLTKYLSKSVEYTKEDSKSVKTLALCWFFHKRSFSVSGHLSELYSDLIKQLNSISNLTCDFTVGFDNSIVFHGVVEWALYGFVKGFVDGWGDKWKDVNAGELEMLEVKGLFERKEL